MSLTRMKVIFVLAFWAAAASGSSARANATARARRRVKGMALNSACRGKVETGFPPARSPGKAFHAADASAGEGRSEKDMRHLNARMDSAPPCPILDDHERDPPTGSSAGPQRPHRRAAGQPGHARRHRLLVDAALSQGIPVRPAG